MRRSLRRHSWRGNVLASVERTIYRHTARNVSPPNYLFCSALKGAYSKPKVIRSFALQRKWPSEEWDGLPQKMALGHSGFVLWVFPKRDCLSLVEDRIFVLFIISICSFMKTLTRNLISRFCPFILAHRYHAKTGYSCPTWQTVHERSIHFCWLFHGFDCRERLTQTKITRRSVITPRENSAAHP